jgi:tripartite motif-containing protein 71
LSGPWGIAASSSEVFVADSGNNRIVKYTSSGVFVAKWGSYGSGNGQFSDPEGIALDRGTGSVYVVDYYNHRVQKFDSNGTFLTKWGSLGSGDGQLNKPMGIGVDSAGYVFVADSSNHRIQKFTSSGSFLTKWGSNGSGESQFRYPAGIALDTFGNVYVSDQENNRIQKFRITTRTQALAPATVTYSPVPRRSNVFSRPGAARTAVPQNSPTRSKSEEKNESRLKKEKY